jgi:PAS domain S-box-containing protein
VGPGRPEQLEAALAEAEDLAAEDQGREEELRQQAARTEEAFEGVRTELLHRRELFEFAPDAYLVTDPAGTLREVNHAATRLFHTAKDFLLGKPLPFLVAAEDRPAFFLRLGELRALEPGAVKAWEVRLEARRAPVVWAAVTVTVEANAPGRPAGFRWLVRDVTARHEAERALRTAKEFTEGLLDTAEAAVVVLDGAGRITRVNAYLEALSGRGRGDLIGRPWADALIPDSDRPAAHYTLSDALAGKKPARAVLGLDARQGPPRSLQWCVKAFTAPAGQSPVMLAVGHDITDLQEAQRRALRAERLAAIGQMVAGLAHESRNALQRSLACLEMLRWKLEGEPGALDLVARALRAQADLLRLYEDVRSYAAPIHLDVGPVDVGEVWREVWADLTSPGPYPGARLEEEAAGVGLACAADRFRLKQVFCNVLDNALAAGREPARVVVACADTTLNGRPALRVAVRDNGPGLTAEDRRHLFEPFYTTKVKGTGLGMAIAKRIVEAHGGEIAAGDPHGGGAEIVIILPRGRTS